MTKRIISFICVAAMLVSMCAVSSFALTVDATVDANWNGLAVKYSSKTKLPITVSEGGVKVVKTEGFEFNTTADGGIDMGVPEYAKFAGAYGASIITSSNKTELEALSVEIDPDNFDFQQDSLTIANSIGILWTEDPIENVDGLATADATAFNGLRHLIPTAKNSDSFVVGQPASEAAASEITGKALYIGITNANPANAGTKIASNVNIVYYDGHYVNDNDGHPGYRWTFTSRNGEGPLADKTPIVQNYEKLDLSEGLKVTIKSHETLGYIVNINGKDYYDGRDVAFFPDANKGLGKSHDAISDEDVEGQTELYLNSMTYAREDIDLSGLKTAGEGYLTIGVTGINDMKMVHGCDIVVEKINNKPAATWAGEPACYHTEKAWKVTKEANCGYEGTEVYACVDCGKVFETKVLPIVGEHVPADEWTNVSKPDCANEGKDAKICTVCGLEAEVKVLPVDPEAHNKAFKTTTPATCEGQGLRERYCKICEATFPEENVVLEPTGHTFENYVADEGYNCETGGTETAKCEDCDATDTRDKAAGEHVAGEWVVTTEPYYDNNFKGVKTQLCANCGTEMGTEAFEIKEFPDVKQSDWFAKAVYYCGARGYISGNEKGDYIPDGKLTREAFVSILARFAGADLSQYTESNFTDVKSSDWFAPYVIWAAENGYVKGVGDGTKFGVGQNMDRQQIATMFFRYAEAAGQDVTGRADLSTYTDGATVATWATDACAWAVSAGLLKSTSTNALTLAPAMTVTRDQAAQIFMNYDNSKA